MGEAYKVAAKNSNAYEADLVAQKQKALEDGDTKTASAIQRQLAIAHTDNRLAFERSPAMPRNCCRPCRCMEARRPGLPRHPRQTAWDGPRSCSN